MAQPRLATAVASGVDRRYRQDAVIRWISGLALWASCLLVSYWWAAGGGIADLASWTSGPTSLGRLTGLLAADLLLLQVLLMSRLPVLERAFGQDRLARMHRVVGFTSFDLMVAHVVLITWGYAGGRIGALPGTAVDLVLNYGGMLLALAGTACLVMVVVTSVRAARRRLRYESWHLIHLYAYLGVGLALPHQLWTGQEFLTSRAATLYWWCLWGAALASVLVWRVGVPVLRSLRHDLRVTGVVREADDVVSVYLHGRRLDRLPVEAGQFITVRFLTGPGWMRGNPYSLSAAPVGDSLRITARALGDSSRTLAAVPPGTRVIFEGPYGRLSARARSQPRVALIGAGVGIAPLRALAEGLDYRPGDAVLLHRYTDQALFAREFEVLGRERGLAVIDLPGRRRAPGSWLGPYLWQHSDESVLLSWIPDVADRDVYICGPAAWAASVQRCAEAAGTPPDRIHVEIFEW
jgi:predicted ferric reductase